MNIKRSRIKIFEILLSILIIAVGLLIIYFS